MEFLKQFFTWWSGQTLGTRLHTWRFGRKAGRDEAGNTYFQTKDGKRRWVIYNGYAEASAIPPEWHGWMHHVTDQLPDAESYAAREWQMPHQANPTGSSLAYRPPGSIASGNRLKPVDPGYEAWRPE